MNNIEIHIYIDKFYKNLLYQKYIASKELKIVKIV